jgi:hypothetical protein
MSLNNPKRPPTFLQEKVILKATNPAAISATATLPLGTMDGDFVVEKFELEMPGGYTADASNYYDISLQVAPVAITSVSSTADTLTLANHGLETGDSVQFTNSGGGLPSGISAGVTYFVVRVSSSVFKLSDTLAHALAGTNLVDLTTNGTGTQSVAKLLGMYSLVTGANGTLTTLVFASATLQNNPTGLSGAQLNVVATKFASGANIPANSVFSAHCHQL